METLRFLMVSTHFPPSHLGGDATFVEYLSRELVIRGHEVHVLFNPSSYRLLRGGGSRKWPDVTSDGVNLHPYSTTFGIAGPVFSLFSGVSTGAAQAARSISDRMRADVVHWHNTKGFVEKPFSIQDSVSLYTAHDYFSVCPRSNLIKPGLVVCDAPKSCQMCLLRWRKPPQLWRSRWNRVIRFDEGVRVLAPSGFVKERLMKDGIKVASVLGNFVPDHSGLEDNLGDHERNLILFIGMLEPHKGPKTLLKAFHQTAHLHGFNLVIIGEGSQRTELLEMISRCNLASRAEAPGFVTKTVLHGLMERAAVVAVPSEWYEVFGLVAIEAFSNGIPVIGSNIGALPEVLGDESGSSLFKPGNTEDIGRSLIETWNERDDLPKRGRKARAAYLERFTPQRHLREYADIIRRES